jgi:hypothetical protein
MKMPGSGPHAACPRASVLAEQIACPETLNVTVYPLSGSPSNVRVSIAEKCGSSHPAAAATSVVDALLTTCARAPDALPVTFASPE